MRYKMQLVGLILLTALSPVALAQTASSQRGASLTALEDQVRHALVTLPYYSVFDNLEFRVEGSKVFLSGQVTRPTLKSGAENVVVRVKGVQSVENTIEVLPLSSWDNRIRLATYWAIYRNLGFTKYAMQPIPPIHIIVKNGNVTLVGVVSSENDKNIANINAHGVSGVFSVTNELSVA